MEEHRKNPACQSCHKVIDPLGLALDNFDTLGAWRIKDNGVDIDSNGVLYDGTKLTGPADLRKALLNHSEAADSQLHRQPDVVRDRPPHRVLRSADDSRRSPKKAAQNGNHFSSFVLGIVNSPAFQMSTAEAVTTTAE